MKELISQIQKRTEMQMEEYIQYCLENLLFISGVLGIVFLVVALPGLIEEISDGRSFYWPDKQKGGDV